MLSTLPPECPQALLAQAKALPTVTTTVANAVNEVTLAERAEWPQKRA